MANRKSTDNRDPPTFIKEWRDALCLTQTELAEKMGRHHTHVLLSEKKKRGTTLLKLVEFSDALGIPWKLLLRPPPSNMKAFVEGLNSSQITMFVALLSELVGYEREWDETDCHTGSVD